MIAKLRKEGRHYVCRFSDGKEIRALGPDQISEGVWDAFPIHAAIAQGAMADFKAGLRPAV